MEWISVKDRLPSETNYFLCCAGVRPFYSRACLMYIIGYGWTINGLKVENVFYWMPLPEPPKE